MENISSAITTILISCYLSCCICTHYFKKMEEEWQRIFDEVTRITSDEIKKYMHD